VKTANYSHSRFQNAFRKAVIPLLPLGPRSRRLPLALRPAHFPASCESRMQI
jgi:hypothetical protein